LVGRCQVIAVGTYSSPPYSVWSSSCFLLEKFLGFWVYSAGFDRIMDKYSSSPKPNGTESQAALLLKKQLRDLKKNPVDGFSAGLVDDSNVFEWEILIVGPPDTLFEGGFFKAILKFPFEYPNLPPKMKFVSDIWHPNIYPNGEVCISILHAPGDDEWGYEKASERWLPVHTVESILVSVISMLSSPNLDSPANIDAAKDYRDQKDVFKKKVQRCVRKSQEG